MIGNDIVDLNEANLKSNWQRKGFLNKIFTDDEQQQIAYNCNPNNHVWELWSKKEAVYKILMQQGGTRGFYPKKIQCLPKCGTTDTVVFNNTIFYTKTCITARYIYSIAVLLKGDLSKIKHICWNENCFKRNEIPFLKINNAFVNISRTHHGRYEKVVYLNI